MLDHDCTDAIGQSIGPPAQGIASGRLAARERRLVDFNVILTARGRRTGDLAAGEHKAVVVSQGNPRAVQQGVLADA